jgi:predicted dehydrogenase
VSEPGPVNVAVVGLGYWGPNLVRVLHELPEANVVAACDMSVERLARVGRRYPALDLTTSYDELLADERVEAVAVATPVSTHHPLVLAALEAGKHVFVEKPLAASSAEAEQLRDVATDLGLTLMPGHTFLYSPPVNLVKRLVDEGELGDIYFISTSRVNLGLHQSDASVVWDLGPHDFSILRYWLGTNPVEVSGTARACIVPSTPDVAFVDLTYANGTVAHVELSWLAPSKLRRTAVVGSQKMVVYDDTASEPVRIFDSGVNLPDPKSFGEYGLTYRTGDIVSPRVDVDEPLALELADLCRAIRTGSEPRSSASVGVDVVRTIEGVDASLGRGGAPVRLSHAEAMR